MTSILGISAFYHDSAAVLVVDGDIVAAAQEERFTRIRHDSSFPVNAIQYCLEKANMNPEEIDYVGFYEKPFLKLERLLENYLAYAPSGFRSFLKAIPLWLNRKIHLPREMRKELGDSYQKRFVFPEHHESHAASAFFPSPFEKAAILTVDGVGEWTTTCFGLGAGNEISLTHELRYPHSLGLLYSAFTYFCGFKVNSGEYKLMGLAPYGEPIYKDLILEKLIDLKQDGSFRMDMDYFNYCQGLTMTSKKFDSLFGMAPRKPESELTQTQMDIAASIQSVTEEIMLRMANHVHEETGMDNLCMAGGVALNCVANGRVLREGPFKEIWIQPAAGDAGGALGVALLIWNQLLGNVRCTDHKTIQGGSCLGPEYSDHKVRDYLTSVNAVYHEYQTEAELDDFVSGQLADGKVVGWMQGRMEFGPRALGSRSILGDPRSTDMQSQLNLKIKFRESFRPFAPAVIREKASEYFEMKPEVESPYMLLVAPVSEKQLLNLNEQEASQTGFNRLHLNRSNLPAVTHVDNSARVQTVSKESNQRFYQLIEAFEKKTGVPVLINTSFNVRGEPIICTPEDAWRCFMATEMDLLVIGNTVLFKEEQTETDEFQKEVHLSKYQLD